MGYFIALSNQDMKVSPLHWKSKVIEKVAEDVKTAETLALETAVDDSIHLADLIAEIYTGKEEPTVKIPLKINEDSASLIESLYSTKKVKRKTMRVVISSIQQNMKRKRIQDIFHVKSQDQLADVFTKSGVHTDRILNVMLSGSMRIKQDQMSNDMSLKSYDMISENKNLNQNFKLRDVNQKRRPGVYR